MATKLFNYYRYFLHIGLQFTFFYYVLSVFPTTLTSSWLETGFCINPSTFILDGRDRENSISLTSNADISKTLTVGFICFAFVMNSKPGIPGILTSERTNP